MNKDQKKYALSRIENIKSSKIKVLRDKYTTKEVTLSDEQRFKALKSGEFKIKKGASVIDDWTRVVNIIEFNNESLEKFNEVAYEKELKLLQAEYERIADELILGDSQQALEMIKSFENF